MVIPRKVHPFFFSIQYDLKRVNDDIEEAANELIKSDPVFYQKSLFRSFLNLEHWECDDMGVDDYIKYTVMLKEHLKLLHAPYLSHEN